MMISTVCSSLKAPVLPKPRSTSRNQVRSMLPLFTICSELKMKQRRSASYHPTIWETKHIESFVTPYNYELYSVQLEELKQITRCLLRTTKDHCNLLKLIDSIKRLGVAYHFEDEIEEAVSLIYADDQTSDLYMTALRFRILRQHGFLVGSDVFDRFRGQDGKFFDSLSGDLQGLLSLYDASYLGMPEENVLEEAKNFTIEKLQNSSTWKMGSFLAKLVEQSLEAPLYWRVPRFEARNFIDLYYMDVTKNTTLLELAQLDYNLVQSLYQKEVKELARWWRELGFKENLAFARDRLMENYLWSVGIMYEPQFSKCRIGLTKFVCLLTAIDDIYDIYGSLEELELFTNAVNRWDIDAMSDLPVYMKISYLAMLNFGNELVYDVLKNHGLNIFPNVKQEWLNLCKSYLVEARWFYSKYTPTVDEYLENSWTSVGGQAALVHACILDCSISESSLDCCFGSKLIYWSSLITRLSDDLGTSKNESKRGDVAKSMECYMASQGISEEEARNRIKEMISHSWKMLNKEILSIDSLPKSLVNMSLNMARTAQFIFQHGDGIGTSTGVTRDRLASLIVKPVPIQTNRE